LSQQNFEVYDNLLELGGPEEDHQLHHCCWTGRVSEREEEEEEDNLLAHNIIPRR